MEQATKPAAAGIKMPETAIHAGPPNGTLNGAVVAPATKTASKPKKKSPIAQVLSIAADLRITVGLFVLAMLIVFWGTLAQVDNGLMTVVKGYFRSVIVFVPLRVIFFLQPQDAGPSIPFPGGWLIGGVMLVNLLAAHAVRFKLSWNRGGIILIHAGIIVMMLSEFIYGVYAVEGSLQIPIGGTVTQVIHPTMIEFAAIKTIDAKTDEVTTVPRRFLEPGAVIDDPRLPFVMQITQYMVNSEVIPIKHGNPDPEARGLARTYVAEEAKEIAGVAQNQRHDAPSMYANLTDRKGNKLGKWLFSAHLEDQFIKIDGVQYNVNLRFKQTPLGFNMHLVNFKHDVYPGTNTPKDFHSYVRLTDEKAGIFDKDAEIFMNSPLAHNGMTFYQQSWTTDPMTRKANGTILQVVHNPGSAMPYISCLMVGVGLLYHFGITLFKFIDRRVVR